MRKIRSFLAAIALIATLSGATLQGAGALTNTITASSVSGVAVHVHPHGPCPGGGSNDC